VGVDVGVGDGGSVGMRVDVGVGVGGIVGIGVGISVIVGNSKGVKAGVGTRLGVTVGGGEIKGTDVCGKGVVVSDGVKFSDSELSLAIGACVDATEGKNFG